MTGVPGGDVTLHAAITAELQQHVETPLDHRWSQCSCGTRGTRGHAAHVAERVLAVLADRLPRTPPDQLAILIGGTVERLYPEDDMPEGATHNWSYVVGMCQPDSPPAAPEPRQDT